MGHGITSRDEMFSVRKAPWHGLGKIVQEAPSVAEAIRLAGLDWEVYTDQLRTADGTAVAAFAVRRKDTGEVVGDSVGPRWTPLQNAAAFEWFQPFLAGGLAELDTAGSLFAGRRVWVLAKLNRGPAEITPGDEVNKFLLLSNSHDGTLAVRCGYTPIRVVCANTLAMAHGNGASALVKLRHTASLADGMAQAQELIQRADSDFEATADVFRQLARKSITGSQFRAYVKQTLELGKPDSEEMSTRARNILAQIMTNLDENRAVCRELLESHRERVQIEGMAHEVIGAALLDELTGNLETGRGQAETQGVVGPSWWHAYNAVTEHLTHQRGRSAETRLDQSWFGAGAALNRTALTNAINSAIA